jgi:hypothetical protein
MMDRKTGRSRGFGFVYVARETAGEALERMHGKILDGRKISVTRAVPEQHTMPGTPANLLASGRGIRTSAPGMRMHGRPNDGCPGDGRPSDGRPGDGRPGDGLLGNGRPGDGRVPQQSWGAGRGRGRADRCAPPFTCLLLNEIVLEWDHCLFQ